MLTGGSDLGQQARGVPGPGGPPPAAPRAGLRAAPLSSCASGELILRLACAFCPDAAMRTGSATMTDAESVVASFASSSRAGRRNALPDIRSPAAPGEASERAAPPQTGAEKEGKQLRGAVPRGRSQVPFRPLFPKLLQFCGRLSRCASLPGHGSWIFVAGCAGCACGHAQGWRTPRRAGAALRSARERFQNLSEATQGRRECTSVPPALRLLGSRSQFAADEGRDF